MNGTTEELIWFLILEHQNLGVEICKWKLGYLLVLAEGVMMNYLKTNEALIDVKHKADTLMPIENKCFSDLISTIDLTDWISVNKEKMAINFERKNSKELISLLKELCSICKDYTLVQMANIFCNKTTPFAIRSDKYYEWYKKHYDEDEALTRQDYVPKKEVREWTYKLFFDSNDSDNNNVYSKDGDIIL